MNQENFIDDAEEASFSLNGMLAGFDENTSAYAHMPTKNPYSHFCFALNIELSAEEVIERLKKYLAELERGECKEALCIEKKMLRKEYWEKGGQLRRNLLTIRERLERERMISAILRVQNGACYDDFLNRLEDSYAEVARLLSEIHKKITQQTYGQFYRYLKSQHDAEPVKMEYDEWMMTEGDNSFKTLKGKQTKEVAEFLRKNLLQHLRKPLQNEIDDVDVNKVIYWMPCDYDRKYLLSEEFKMQCARFRWNISWEGDILKFDYDALGEYMFKNYYKMTDKERQAFFDLDVKVEMINEDIAKVMPVEEQEEWRQGQEDTVLEPLRSEKATGYKQKLVKAGIIDSNWQPINLSRADKGELAMQLATKLDISNVWQVFGKLWSFDSEQLRTAYNNGCTQKKSEKRRKYYKEILI